MKKAVIAGGSGFIGAALSKLLHDRGCDVVVLSRTAKAPAGARGVKWDARTLGPWKDELEHADLVVNLTGDAISQHWSKDSKNRILVSRIESTQVIAEAIAASASKPAVWINSSAIGYYGDRGAEELSESSPPGKKGQFVVDTCVAWEAIVQQAEVGPTRKVRLRTGVVLGRGGGFFEPIYKLTKSFLGGTIGSGDQYISWLHIEDLTRLIAAIADGEVEGEVVNACSPDAVTNEFFMATIRGVAGRPFGLPTPAFLLKIANFFGAPDPSLLLEGQRVVPKAAMDAGFEFRYPRLKEALVDLARS